jgi:hypothetical protein
MIAFDYKKEEHIREESDKTTGAIDEDASTMAKSYAEMCSSALTSYYEFTTTASEYLKLLKELEEADNYIDAADISKKLYQLKNKIPASTYES